jgi:hypothetical protein
MGIVTRSRLRFRNGSVMPLRGLTDRGNVPKTTRMAAVVVAALVALVACTSNPADPGTSSTPVPPASASPVVSPSSVPTSTPSSSSVKPTPSVADPTTPNPWPDNLTPEQVADAQAALALYAQFQAVIDRAGANPSRDWSTEIEGVATAAAKNDLVLAIAQTAENGQRTTGSTAISPSVVGVEPGLVKIVDCVDASAADFLDSSGNSIKAPDAPGYYYRHSASAQVVELQDGTWRVAIAVDDWATPC